MKKYIFSAFIVFILVHYLFNNHDAVIRKHIGSNASTSTIDQEILNVDETTTIQENEEINRSGKYKHISPEKMPLGTKYQVDEYETPDGQKGYQVYVTKPDGSKKSYGVGPDASFRSYDWKTSDAVSSSTIK